jgi:hypothetical protein
MNLYKYGKECLLCLSRKKIIITTPEEKVRQQWITNLIETYDVPANMIQVEVPLSRYDPTLSGRVDIIVSGKNKVDSKHYPLLVVECKAPNVPLTELVVEQAQNYDVILEPKVTVVTNGQDTKVFQWIDEKSDYSEIQHIPPYDELLTEDHFPAKETVQQWKRPDHLNIEPSELNELLQCGIIGEDTEPKLYSFATNLVGLFLDEKEGLHRLEVATGRLEQDCLTRYTTFGNTTGGGWTGEYRSLLIKDKAADHQIISFSVMGKGKTKDHPLYGNSKGHTMLLAAVDDYDKSHLSLQLALDRFLHIDGDMYTVWHDGTLTVGKKGAAKKSEVFDFIREHNPTLIENDKVVLGKLDNSARFSWERKDVREFVSNLVDYSLLRDQFRRTK